MISNSEARINRAYAERNALAVAFCKLAISLGWSGGRGLDAGMDDGWGHLVYVDTPNGQVSWHIHPDQVYLLDGLPAYTKRWDGQYAARDIKWAAELKIVGCTMCGSDSHNTTECPMLFSRVADTDVCDDRDLEDLAVFAARVCKERHAYMPDMYNREWKPHKWVLDAMRAAMAAVKREDVVKKDIV